MGVVVRMVDARSVKLCSRGLRKACLSHNIDWDRFLEVGIDSDELTPFMNPMLEKMIEAAKDREANGSKS